MRRFGLLLIVALVALSTVGCGLCGLLASRSFLAPGPTAPTSGPATEIVIATPTPLPPEFHARFGAEEELLVNLYKRVNPAVVNIRVVKLVDTEDMPLWSEDEELYQQGQGSGFVLDGDGHIVTNNHVVSDAEEVEVIFHDGSVALARVVGTDPDSDLAVVKVDVQRHLLTAVELGDSDDLEVGQTAIAIGNPFGLNGTLTVGIISALGRTLPLGRISEQVGGRFSIPEIIQTDAAINPGNSGGPLLNSQGAVIGINTAINSGLGASSGVGFAVPVNTIRQVIPGLIADGYYAYPWLGVTGRDLDSILVDAMQLPVERGAVIMAVTPGGPADSAGLRAGSDEYETKYGTLIIGGDVIIGVDDTPVLDFDDLLGYLIRETRPGQRIRLTIVRDGEERTVGVTLGERPRD